MLQTIVTVIAFLICGIAVVFLGDIAVIIIVGLLGAILVNVLLSHYDIRTEIVELRKDIAEFKKQAEQTQEKQ